MRHNTLILAGLLVSLTLAPLQAAEGAKGKAAGKPAPFEPDRTLVYKTAGDVKLALEVFLPPDHKPEASRPAIVFFFGGGWVGGSPKQFYPHCRYLASRGMVAVSAEYRVRNRHGTTPWDCVRDGKSAVRWVRANARQLGVDPKRIAAGGGSAGGHVAACTGTIDGLDEPGEDAAVPSRPDAMALFNPVIDTGPGGYGYSRLKEKYKEISPVEHVEPGVPPTILFHGTGDTTVPLANCRDFQERMKKAGNRCELLTFEGASHGFFNYGRGDGTAFVETVRAMDRFLIELGYLEGEPTISSDFGTPEE